MRTEKLSGGMRQLLGIAFLLLADTQVLLLDEPGLSLDPGWRKWLQQKLRFEAERGKTILITTHLIAEWNNVANRCLLCRDGIIERELDPRNLPDDFDELESAKLSPASRDRSDLGSARVSRAGFGVAPKRTFQSGNLHLSDELQEKSANARTRSPARGTYVLPRATQQPL